MSTKASSTKPGSLGAILDPLASLYHRRWLIRYLVQSQVVKNFRDSHLGLVWAFLGPLMMVALLTLVFSQLIGIKFREVTGDSSLNFGLYLYCGLLPFMAYQDGINNGLMVIRRNSDLIKKVVFPLEILPLTTVLESLIIRNVFGVGALMLILVVVTQRLYWTALLLPLIWVLQLVFAAGLSYLMAVAGTYVPDIKEASRAVVRATFFITPILWPTGKVPENLRFLVDFNPLAFLVEAYRDLLLEGELPSAMTAIYFSLFAVALFAIGFAAFNRVKHNFGEMI